MKKGSPVLLYMNYSAVRNCVVYEQRDRTVPGTQRRLSRVLSHVTPTLALSRNGQVSGMMTPSPSASGDIPFNKITTNV